WLEIDLSSAILFESGSDRLTQSATVVIEEIAKTLRDNRQIISVRGHTDNLPIETERFRSNWALSAGRAVAVVRLLQRLRIAPQRLQAQGHGEFQPVATNDSVQGRAKNRRVTIAISRYALQESTQAAAQSRLQPNAKDASENKDSVTVPATKTASETEESTEQKYEVVRLPNGGLLIRGKKLPPDEKQP
ncbi:MAG: OmpA family protein, partial [Gammaproteobacteria bacterium]|nr:OmpA family protein [Gammaproteobacteria bacterium]